MGEIKQLAGMLKRCRRIREAGQQPCHLRLTIRAIEPADGIDYAVLESAYDYKTLFNDQGVQLSSEYGRPQAWQAGRSMRLKLGFTF